jgi:peptidoglycan-associated lipoprotein
MRLKKFLTVLVLSVLSTVVFSQHKLTIKADQAFEKGYWSSAIENYRLALKKEKNAEIKLRIIFNLAQSYSGAKDYKNSVTWLKKVKNKGKAFLKNHPEVLLKLADSYKAMERYTDAMASYNEYSEIMPDDEKGERGSKSCELAIKWTQNPTRYKIKNERLINSKFDDAIPVYSNKRYKEIVYQSYRSGAEGKGTNDVNGQAYPDLYSSKLQKDGKWTSPTPLQGDKDNGVNTAFAEGGPAMNSKMNEIYFTRCKNYEGKSKKEKSCQIYSSKKRGAAYGDAVILEIGNDSVIVAHPTLTNKDQTIYFVSNMKGGRGGKDIWMADYDKKKKKWLNIRNLGPEVNTPGDELYPFVHADGTLYFSSNGHVGIGGFDIFKVEKLEDGWGPVMNLKVPINSSSDDISIIFEAESERGYLTSNRNGGRGKMDLWSFNLPKLVLFVQGIVMDKQTKVILPNSKVTMVGSDGSSVEGLTDETGGYKFKLLPNTTYQLQADNDLTTLDNFGNEVKMYFASEKALVSTIGVEESKTFVQDLELERIPIEKGIELPNIVYAFDKADLLSSSKLKLNILVETMKDNPTLVIELGSHTDFRGSAKYNRNLAQRRAQSAVNYLISKGISKNRMIAKGYGEDAPKELDSAYVQKAFFGDGEKGPIATNYSTTTKRGKLVSASFDEQKNTFVVGIKLDESTINRLSSEGLQECAHQMNRRTEFKVLRTDYKSGETAQGPGADRDK